jgi:TolB-like protein/DNA-binding winged helix-turn-helix (wHTH) protein/Tfp pilus assembly protein PilF
MERVVSNVAASISALRLDLGNECLWWGDQPIALTPKAFAVLRYLVERKGQLVTKEALLEAVWPGAYVEAGQVKQFVAELRRILHDDSTTPRFIETVRGRGYRLIGDIGLRTPDLSLVEGMRRASQGAREAAAATPAPGAAEAAARVEEVRPARPRLDGRPAIAVLPFRNLGGDPRDALLAEGITEDIIDGLARNRSLSVIGRHSALRSRDGRADAKRIALELGVGYILDGTVRRRAPELRISANLVDAAQDRTIWAEKYDGTQDELFGFQERVASSVVATVEPRLLEAEVARLRSKPVERFDAYDWVLRASSLLYTLDEHDLWRAGADLDRAAALDPAVARTHAYKAWWYVLCICEERSADPARDTALAEAAARRAIALDPTDSFVLAVAAHVQALLQRRPEAAADMFDASLQLNDSSAFAWGLSGVTQCYLGLPDEALGRLSRAWRLSPFDPLNFMLWSAAGLAEFLAGRYDRATVWLDKALRQNPRFVASHRTLTTCLWHAGRRTEAKAAARNLLALDRNFRIAPFAARYPLRRQGDMRRYMGGLRAAGLPE